MTWKHVTVCFRGSKTQMALIFQEEKVRFDRQWYLNNLQKKNGLKIFKRQYRNTNNLARVQNNGTDM